MTDFDEQTYQKIAGLLPPERLSVHLGSFERQLRECFRDPSDVEGMKNAAHKLISQAGMPGFVELSARCGDLEAACEGDRPVPPALAALRASADTALERLAQLKDRSRDGPG